MYSNYTTALSWKSRACLITLFQVVIAELWAKDEEIYEV